MRAMPPDSVTDRIFVIAEWRRIPAHPGLRWLPAAGSTAPRRPPVSWPPDRSLIVVTVLVVTVMAVTVMAVTVLAVTVLAVTVMAVTDGRRRRTGPAANRVRRRRR